MDSDAREALFGVFPQLARDPEAFSATLPTLRSYEARLLAA